MGSKMGSFWAGRRQGVFTPPVVAGGRRGRGWVRRRVVKKTGDRHESNDVTAHGHRRASLLGEENQTNEIRHRVSAWSSRGYCVRVVLVQQRLLGLARRSCTVGHPNLQLRKGHY